MATAQKYCDADFAMFEPVTTRNAAKKVAVAKPNSKKQPDLKVISSHKKTKKEAKAEMKMTAKTARKILATSILLVSMFALLISSRARLDEITREAEKTEALLAQAQSESVRLNAEIDSMVSLEDVEDYAVNVLGMKKIEKYQVEFIDLTGVDRVTKSNKKDFKNILVKDDLHNRK